MKKAQIIFLSLTVFLAAVAFASYAYRTMTNAHSRPNDTQSTALETHKRASSRFNSLEGDWSGDIDGVKHDINLHITSSDTLRMTTHDDQDPSYLTYKGMSNDYSRFCSENGENIFIKVVDDTHLLIDMNNNNDDDKANNDNNNADNGVLFVKSTT